MGKSLDETMKYMTKLQSVIKDLMNYTEFEKMMDFPTMI